MKTFNALFSSFLGKSRIIHNTDMNRMFFGASKFNQPIGYWNTSKVKSFRQVFFGATHFNQQLYWSLENNTDNYMGMFSYSAMECSSTDDMILPPGVEKEELGCKL